MTAVSAPGMPCTYFLQKMELLLTLFHFTSPFLTSQDTLTLCQAIWHGPNFHLGLPQWEVDVLPLVFMVSMPSRAVLAPPCISYGNSLTLHLV